MKILLTNDDGVFTPGLWALAAEIKKVGRVVVVAPDREQSALGTSLTLHQPIRAREVEPPVPGIDTYAVEGTPGDSVIFALRYLFKGEVGLVISGINEGANLGNDVFISGTVGAALQGYFYGLPSLAISVGDIKEPRFEAAAVLARLLVQQIVQEALPQRILLNVNLPNIDLKQIQGIEVTRLASRVYADEVQEGHDGKRKYYWIVRGKPQWAQEPGTDKWALEQKRISITPLQNNLTSPSPTSALREMAPILFQELLSPEPGLSAESRIRQL